MRLACPFNVMGRILKVVPNKKSSRGCNVAHCKRTVHGEIQRKESSRNDENGNANPYHFHTTVDIFDIAMSGLSCKHPQGREFLKTTNGCCELEKYQETGISIVLPPAQQEAPETGR
jgi:hypothetical protein